MDISLEWMIVGRSRSTMVRGEEEGEEYQNNHGSAKWRSLREAEAWK